MNIGGAVGRNAETNQNLLLRQFLQNAGGAQTGCTVSWYRKGRPDAKSPADPKGPAEASARELISAELYVSKIQ